MGDFEDHGELDGLPPGILLPSETCTSDLVGFPTGSGGLHAWPDFQNQAGTCRLSDGH